ncbi:hypothetical protein D3C71_2097040 [compost metagenome]
MLFAAVGKDVAVADDVVEIDVDGGPGEAEPGDLHRGRLVVEDADSVVHRMALQIDENVDLFVTDRLCRLLV